MSTHARESVGFVSRAPMLTYVGPFDGFRGLGVVLVLFAHATERHLAGLAAVVDLFFVISGFLIVTLLLEEYRRDGEIRLRSFYAKRALRLLPVLYLVLAFTFVGGMLVGDAAFREQVISDVLSAGLYVYHVVHPVNYPVVGGGIPEARPLIQLWSLSVEEHFYLFGGVLTVLAIRWRMVKLALVGLLGFVAFVAVARATGHVGWRIMWYQRPDAIAVGVSLALLNALAPPELSDTAERVLRWLGGIAVVVWVGVIFIGTTLAEPLGVYFQMWPEPGGSLDDGVYWGEFGYSVSAIASGVIVVAMLRAPGVWFARMLSVKPLRTLGRRSYPIYLIHFPLGMLLLQWADGSDKKGLVAILAYLPLLVLTVELAHRYVERPAMRLRVRRGLGTPQVGAAGSPQVGAAQPSEDP